MRKGFSLIEILIYIVIVGVIAIVFVTFVIDITVSAQKSRVNQEVQQQLRFSMQRIIQEIQAADDINTGASTFDLHPGVLSLATDDVSTNPTLFSLNNGQLEITEGVAAAQALTSSKYVVTNFVVEDLSVAGRTKVIRVSITMEHPNPENVEIYNVNQTLTGSAVIREEVD